MKSIIRFVAVIVRPPFVLIGFVACFIYGSLKAGVESYIVIADWIDKK
jgi:hypothetical protein